MKTTIRSLILSSVLLLSNTNIASALPDYRYFVAGGTCAAISHGITTPIDVVKTKMQAIPEKYEGKGLIGSSMVVLKEDGPSALLGGLGPTVVGYGIEGAMKFGVYEITKPLMISMLKTAVDADKTIPYILASILAGGVASILLCPMESTRIRVVTNKEYDGMGLLTALPKLINEEGLLSTFAGLYAMLAKQVPYTMAKQVSFDIVAKMLYSFFDSKGDSITLAKDTIKWIVSICSAFIASIFACIFSQPGDMILTETYKGASDSSFVKVIKKINSQGGLPAFFTGTGARIVHVGMIITTQLVMYDVVKQALGLPATGSH